MAEVSDDFSIDFSGIDKLKVNFTHTISTKTETEMIRKLLDYMDKGKYNCGYNVYNDPIPFCPKAYNKLLKLSYWDNLKDDEKFMLSGHIVLSKPHGKFSCIISFWDYPDKLEVDVP